MYIEQIYISCERYLQPLGKGGRKVMPSGDVKNSRCIVLRANMRRS